MCTHTQGRTHTGLPMVSYNASDLQVAVTLASKGREEEECKLVNMDASNAEFIILINWALQMFYVKGNAFLSLMNFSE